MEKGNQTILDKLQERIDTARRDLKDCHNHYYIKGYIQGLAVAFNEIVFARKIEEYDKKDLIDY